MSEFEDKEKEPSEKEKEIVDKALKGDVPKSSVNHVHGVKKLLWTDIDDLVKTVKFTFPRAINLTLLNLDSLDGDGDVSFTTRKLRNITVSIHTTRGYGGSNTTVNAEWQEIIGTVTKGRVILKVAKHSIGDY